jgi:hypothetical protein
MSGEYCALETLVAVVSWVGVPPVAGITKRFPGLFGADGDLPTIARKASSNLQVGVDQMRPRAPLVMFLGFTPSELDTQMSVPWLQANARFPPVVGLKTGPVAWRRGAPSTIWWSLNPPGAMRKRLSSSS